MLSSVVIIVSFLYHSFEVFAIAIKNTEIQFYMSADNRTRIEGLPWHLPMEEWVSQGLEVLNVRRGDSRHPVLFVERGGVRYAIKETTPRMAEREIRNFREIERRGIPALSPIGVVISPAPPVALDVPQARWYYTIH